MCHCSCCIKQNQRDLMNINFKISAIFPSQNTSNTARNVISQTMEVNVLNLFFSLHQNANYWNIPNYLSPVRINSSFLQLQSDLRGDLSCFCNINMGSEPTKQDSNHKFLLVMLSEWAIRRSWVKICPLI